MDMSTGPNLEVHVEGEDADELVDQLVWNVLLQCRLVDRVVEIGDAAGLGRLRWTML